jgi:hypothetical protein
VVLSQVVSVTVDQSSLERRIGVGRVRTLCTGNSPAELILDGVVHPADIAALIRERAQHAGAAIVTGTVPYTTATGLPVRTD